MPGRGHQPPQILVVDHGVSFGGSALVAAVIARRMPMARYRVDLVTGFPVDPLRLRGAPGQIREIRKQYSYVEQTVHRAAWAQWPAPLRRMAGRLDFGRRLTLNAGYVRRLVEWIRSRQVDLVHLNNGFENLEAHLAARLTATPVVFHAHGPCGNSRLTRRLARSAQACIAISAPVARSFRDAGLSTGQVHVLPNPLTVDPRPLQPAERAQMRIVHGIPNDAVVAGIVGRIIPWKGQLEFLRAAAVAVRVAPLAHFAVIGDVTDANGAYWNRLRQEAEQLGIADRVHFTGFIGDPREVYAILDLLVHASIEPEPFGLVLTEAMALSLPVVAADAGGPLEIVRHGVDGYLCDPRDAGALGSRMGALLANPVLRQKIGAAAAESVRHQYDPDAYVERLAAIYDAVLRGQ